MIITVWQRQVKQKWEHNHISDCFFDSETVPTAVTEDQKNAWNGVIWRKFKAQLIDGKVIMS